ncbi:MAG: alpha/beta hydrolase [Actinomycetota bacterium]
MTTPDHVIPSSGGVDVAVHELGGEGPPLLLCHATGFHGRCWEPTARHLTDRYRCIAPDLRGHGDSPVPPELELHWSGFADDLLAVIDALDLGPVRAAGWSMGAAALVLAEQRRPGTIHSAFLFEPIIFPVLPTGPNPMAPGARKRREVFASRDEAFDNYLGKGPFANADPAALHGYVEHGFSDRPDGSVILKCRGEIEAQVYEHHGHDAWDRLDELDVPLVLAMSGDGGRPAQLVPLLAERVPGATLLRLDELTHMAPLEDPAAVAEAVADAVG